ncbi:MAG TPA: hypothetical protein VGL86_28595 [Polyangia bacterium]|jgi:hypothetical protein
MRRLALIVLLASGIARGDQPALVPKAQPAFMPAPPRPISTEGQAQAKRLRHEAAAYGAIGLGVFAGGIAIDVVALDVPQGTQASGAGGIVTTMRVRNDANWAELAAGLTLTAAGVALVALSLYKLKQARRVDESGD